MSTQDIHSGLTRYIRKFARLFGYRFDHPAEVIVGFPLNAFR